MIDVSYLLQLACALLLMLSMLHAGWKVGVLYGVCKMTGMRVGAGRSKQDVMEVWPHDPHSRPS